MGIPWLQVQARGLRADLEAEKAREGVGKAAAAATTEGVTGLQEGDRGENEVCRPID